MEAPVWDLLTNDTQLPTLSPAVPPYVKLGLTIAYTVFYSLLFLFVYVQLWLILHYRHKRFSYQTVFLFLCLLWAGLRTVLFSFYFRNFVTANSLSPFVFWLLYCFPVCLQFFTLSLMNLYFVQVYLVDEECSGCSKFGHTVAICPSQYQGEVLAARMSQNKAPQRTQKEPSGERPPALVLPEQITSREIWYWLVDIDGDMKRDLPVAINVLWA
ncbi:UNVERIFIED_CONTAM: hypothetical protein FKN15_013461 [Acipenser sinensis]